MFSWLWAAWTELPIWGMVLWIVYLLYFLGRSYKIWIETSNEGIAKGYKYVFFGRNPKHIRLYHVLRMVFDIPPAIVGLFFPFFKAVAKLKLYTFKQPEDTSKTKNKELQED